MESKNSSYLTTIIFWYVLGFLHLGLFFYNFFPIKSVSSTSLLGIPEYINGISLAPKNNYQQEFDRLIFIVIDALRYDFVSKHQMPYVYSQINKQEGCFFPAKAEAPTVTLPRIKALTSGSLPEFIDLILNFVSKEMTEDSFLHRAKELGKKLVFYGDNTWLKLFPTMFLRSEGTTSFYITDFTEVDNNVTRHLANELYEKKDWDYLFLHYLGLDHIGHVHGPFHPLIDKKLQEMDEIIRYVQNSVYYQDRKTLILICGDHGMRDSGGHGGSTPSETLIPLIFLGTHCNQNPKLVAQIDVVPTLATLLGLPIPTDNIGKLIPALATHEVEKRLFHLHYNALNLIQKNYEEFRNEFREVFDNHAQFLKIGSNCTEKLIAAYEEKINKISQKLIQSSTIQNVPFLYLSLSEIILVLTALIVPENQIFLMQISLITTSLIIILFFLPNDAFFSHLTSLYCLLPLIITISKFPDLFKLFVKFNSSPILLFLSIGSIVRTIALISTSLIEEEQQVWFFLWGGVCIFGAYQEFQARRSWKTVFAWVFLIVGLRFLRHLNHTGVWESVPDFADWLLLPGHGVWLLLVFVAGLTGVAFSCSKIYRCDKTLNTLSTLTTLSILWYRTTLYYNKYTVFEARITVILILCTGIIGYVKHRNIFKALSMMWMLWIALLMRPYNVILIPICVAASRVLNKLCTSKKALLLFHVWLGYILFHCQGFSNSLSSVDLSPGYVGLSEFSLFLTSLQVVCHTYSFQILTVLLLFTNSNFSEQVKMLHTVIILRLFSIAWYCLVMIIHKEHLFIWSVFSPKLIIESCHALCLLIVLIIYFILSRICINKKSICGY